MYYMFGFLFLVFLILIITCSEATILLCYFHLCAEVVYLCTVHANDGSNISGNVDVCHEQILKSDFVRKMPVGDCPQNLLTNDFMAFHTGLSLVVAVFHDEWFHWCILLHLLCPLLRVQTRDLRICVHATLLWIHFHHGLCLLPVDR